MKKVGLLLLTICLSVLLCGCDKLIPLSEEENDMIAEYVAMLMLKYDSEYTNKLTSNIELKEDPTIVTEEFEVLGEDTPDETDEDSDTTSKDGSREGNGQNGGKSSKSTQKIEWNMDDVTTIPTMFDGAFSVRYKDAAIYQSYPDKNTDDYFTLEATEGKKLVVVSFTIMNNSASEATFSQLDSDLLYRLDIKGEAYIKPSMTLLMNDLQYIDVKLEPKKAAEAVLVFLVDENTSLGDCNILVYNDEKTAIEKLK